MTPMPRAHLNQKKMESVHEIEFIVVKINRRVLSRKSETFKAAAIHPLTPCRAMQVKPKEATTCWANGAPRRTRYAAKATSRKHLARLETSNMKTSPSPARPDPPTVIAPARAKAMPTMQGRNANRTERSRRIVRHSVCLPSSRVKAPASVPRKTAFAQALRQIKNPRLQQIKLMSHSAETHRYVYRCDTGENSSRRAHHQLPEA